MTSPWGAAAGVATLGVALILLRRVPREMRQTPPNRKRAEGLAALGALWDASGFYLLMAGLGVRAPWAAGVGVLLGALAWASAKSVMVSLQRHRALRP
ncbi:MAG: hypothetical protein ACYDBQ_08090 [Thermoplasmatota archaeon]